MAGQFCLGDMRTARIRAARPARKLLAKIEDITAIHSSILLRGLDRRVLLRFLIEDYELKPTFNLTESFRRGLGLVKRICC